MNTLGLHPVYQPRDPSKRYKGIAIVIALHIVIIYGIVSGTAKNAFLATKKSLEAVVIQEVIIPPPPPPPPKEIKPVDVPKSEAPPPPFVPPPDVAPTTQSTSAVTIASSTTPPPAPVAIAPPPPAPAVPVQTGPVKKDIAVACPSQVAPEMPRKALQDGTEGVVKAEVTIKDGAVIDVSILSGPRVFHAAVRAAMMQYKCLSGAGETKAVQEFAFKIE
jgi:protein TonB